MVFFAETLFEFKKKAFGRLHKKKICNTPSLGKITFYCQNNCTIMFMPRGQDQGRNKISNISLFFSTFAFVSRKPNEDRNMLKTFIFFCSFLFRKTFKAQKCNHMFSSVDVLDLEQKNILTRFASTKMAQFPPLCLFFSVF